MLMSISAQVLLRENSMPYWNDSIIMYQQPYVENVDSGEDCVWDFSLFDESNAISTNHYTITGKNILGKHQAAEHIYYQEKSDSLFIIGRESSYHKVTYLVPEPVLKYPFQYGDTINQHFTIKEAWGSGYSQVSYGNVYIKADGKGTLILPTDTLDSIIRIYTRKEYKTINSDSISLIYHSWNWYSQLFCHPIVEMVKVFNGDSTSIAYSLYRPTSDYHRRNKKHIITHAQNANVDNTAINNVTCFPNPVMADVSVYYTLSTPVTIISFAIYSSNGICAYTSQLHEQYPGAYLMQIPMTNLPQGVYTLCISLDEYCVRKEIMKM